MNNEELVDIGQQTVRKKRQRPEQQPQTEPGDNRKYINHSLRLVDLGKVDMANNEAVTERVRQYFQICSDDDMKPSVAGLAVALGVDRGYLWEIRTGRKGKSPEVADTLKRAVNLLDLQMTDYMQNGKINPVSGIFLMKNNFGYTDKQEVVVTPNNPLGDTGNQAAIEQGYIESTIVEE